MSRLDTLIVWVTGKPRRSQINGYCPMGCGQTLERGRNGDVVCRKDSCPAWYAATYILDDEHELKQLADRLKGQRPSLQQLPRYQR